MFATGKISMTAARNLIGVAENSTFIGHGHVNMTASGITIIDDLQSKHTNLTKIQHT